MSSTVLAHGGDMRLFLVFPIVLLAAIPIPTVTFYLKRATSLNALVCAVLAFCLTVLLISAVMVALSPVSQGILGVVDVVQNMFLSRDGVILMVFLFVASALLWKPIFWVLRKIHPTWR
jgi:hypothetical protein